MAKEAMFLTPALPLSVLLLLLGTIAPLSTGGASTCDPESIITAEPGQRIASIDVLVFQTSLDVRVPCFTRLIRPPRFYEPPVRVVIATPTENGTFPVILFKHGFSMANCFYTQLFKSLASSGYIIVAPQAVTLNSNAQDEIEETAKVANWISTSLQVVLNAAVSGEHMTVPDMSRLVMAGHSRGGKIAFAMALEMASIQVPSFSALVALDPVDGTAFDSILYPPIVAAGCNRTRNMIPVPVLILGTGYGSDTGLLGAPACAPACCSHMAYFNCSSALTMYHLVASDYGHLDFLDDLQTWTSIVCKSGDSKAPLRDFSAKLVRAFLESALEGEQEGLASIVGKWESASIALEEPQVYTQASALHVPRKEDLPISKRIAAV